MGRRPNDGDYARKQREFEREYWRDVFQLAQGSIREAARISGVSPGTTHKAIKRLGFKVVVVFEDEETDR